MVVLYSSCWSFSKQHESFCESLVDYNLFFPVLQSVTDSEAQHVHKPSRNMYSMSGSFYGETHGKMLEFSLVTKL